MHVPVYTAHGYIMHVCACMCVHNAWVCVNTHVWYMGLKAHLIACVHPTVTRKA